MRRRLAPTLAFVLPHSSANGISLASLKSRHIIVDSLHYYYRGWGTISTPLLESDIWYLAQTHTLIHRRLWEGKDQVRWKIAGLI